jgi:pimeloyl-ACP methyl ester carboxylesterase
MPTASFAGISDALSLPFELYLGPGFIRADGGGTGSAESPAFGIYLGLGFSPAEGGAIGSDISAPFAVYLGEGFQPPGSGAVGSGNSPAFAMNTGQLHEGFAQSAVFPLDTRLSYLVRVTSPTASDVWVTDEERQLSVLWTSSHPEAARLRVKFSADAGRSWRHLSDANVSVSNGYWTDRVSLARADTVGARVALDLYSGANLFLGSVESADFAAGNNGAVRLDVQRFNQSAFSPPVLYWNAIEGATTYQVLVTADGLTSCQQASWGPVVVPAPKRYRVIDKSAWEALPAARYSVWVVARDQSGLPIGLPQIRSFVRFKLSDVDPYDTENKPPVVLVHGWTSDQNTWFTCDESPFIDGLINGPPGKRFHPWAFEYPNIQSIVHSAAGLETAVNRVLAGGYASARVVAHSMGGLVSRAYLQGFAVDPSLDHAGIYPAVPPTGTVSHLVTLSTPHLGEPPEAVYCAAHFNSTGRICGHFRQWRSPSCPGCEQSQSSQDLRNDSPLIARLNAAQLPAINYLFTGGIDGHGDEFGRARGSILEGQADCNIGADATVDICSALTTCGGNHPTGQVPLRFAPGSTEVRARYSLSHSRMSRPGNTYANYDECDKLAGHRKRYSDYHASESQYLLNDVLGFLRCSSCLPSSSCPNPQHKEFRQRIVAEQSGTVSAAEADTRGVSLSTEPLLPVSGAQVRVYQLNASRDLVGMLAFSDAGGEARFALLPGEYGVELSTPGYETRVDTIIVTGSGVATRTANLVRIPGYDGPRNPRILINGAAPASTSAVVTIDAACDGATEVFLTEDPTFASGAWQSIGSAISFPLSSAPGNHHVFAKFRDGLGRETSSISESIQLVSSSGGSVLVSSSPPGVEILVDGLATGRSTPSEFDLPAGFHSLSVRSLGVTIIPSSSSILIRNGETESVAFTLTAAAAPSAADWGTVGDTWVRPGTILQWHRAIPAAADQLVFYDLSICPDSSMSGGAWTLFGHPDTTLAIPLLPDDSTEHFCSVRSIAESGVPQTGPAALLRVRYDATAPELAVLFPSADAVVNPAQADSIVLRAQDWSGIAGCVISLSTNGGVSYEQIYSGPVRDTLSWSPPHMNADSCFIRLAGFDHAGNAATVLSPRFELSQGVSATSGNLPVRFDLRVNPQPVRGIARIAFDVPSRSDVTLAVYDVLGRRIQRLVQGVREAGRHSLQWDARKVAGNAVAPGLYFVRLEAGTISLSSRVVILQ